MRGLRQRRIHPFTPATLLARSSARPNPRIGANSHKREEMQPTERVRKVRIHVRENTHQDIIKASRRSIRRTIYGRI